MKNKIICPICGGEKKEKNKYCSFKCRNIVINRNRNYNDLSYKKNRKKAIEKKWKKFEVKCFKCDKLFEVKEYDVDKPKKEKYFCSISCANSRVFSLETIKKKSESAKNSEKVKKANKINLAKVNKSLIEKGKEIDYKKYKKKCINCKIDFEVNNWKKKQIFCSRKCKTEYDRKDLSEQKIYKLDTAFKFVLKDYPEEFEFSLIKKHGWYKAKNRGDNLNGVSRDHMFSVKEGFNQKIDPFLIAHPANCKLIIQRNNSSKRSKCSITHNELLNRIETWNKKYGDYYKIK